jgi:hypothetical protein
MDNDGLRKKIMSLFWAYTLLLIAFILNIVMAEPVMFLDASILRSQSTPGGNQCLPECKGLV